MVSQLTFQLMRMLDTTTLFKMKISGSFCSKLGFVSKNLGAKVGR